MLGRQTQEMVVTWLLLPALVQSKLSSPDWARCNVGTMHVSLNCCFKYLQNVPIVIHHWNKFIVYPEMHGNKWQDINLALEKYSSSEVDYNFWFSAKQQTHALWNTRTISIIMWSYYISLLMFVQKKTVSHAIQWSLRKDRCAQSFRIDDKMFLSSEGQMWWIHGLGGSTINETVIILLQAFFFLS